LSKILRTDSEILNFIMKKCIESLGHAIIREKHFRDFGTCTTRVYDVLQKYNLFKVVETPFGVKFKIVYNSLADKIFRKYLESGEIEKIDVISKMKVVNYS
jgi:hypothetical protein